MSFCTSPMEAREDGRNASDDGDGVHGGGRSLEEREEAGHQEDASCHHGGSVDQSADRRRALHGVGEPRVQRELGRLAHGASEDANRRSRWTTPEASTPPMAMALWMSVITREFESLGGEAIAVEEEVHYGQKEAEVAQPGDDERLLGGRGGRGPVVPKADKEVGAQAHQPPRRRRAG